jgi:hypothetical protein
MRIISNLLSYCIYNLENFLFKYKKKRRENRRTKMSNQSSASIKDSTFNELKLNYKKYIELKLLENILLNVIQPSQDDDDDDNDDKNSQGRIVKQDDKILTKYLNTLTATTTTTNNNNNDQLLFNEIEQTKLDLENKNYLTYRLNHVLTNRIETISNLLVNNSDLNEIIIMNNNNDNNLIMKQHDHCVTGAIETSKLIKEMLNTYRIGFYLNENKLKYQLKLTESDTFMAKIRTVVGELNDDLYMSNHDKLQALSCIRNLIDLNTDASKQKLEQINDYLSRFKSLGNEFNDLLANYKLHKEQLACKRYALNKLKENN